MEKTLFFVLFSIFCNAQLTKEENDIASAIVSRQLTSKEQARLDGYMNKKFVNSKTLLADTEKIIKAGLYIPLEDEATCAGLLIAHAKKDAYRLTNKTYEQIWDAAGEYCREYYYPSLEAQELKQYNKTRFDNLISFEAETKRLITKNTLKITYDILDSAVQFVKTSFNEGANVSELTYGEIIGNGKLMYDRSKTEVKPIEQKPIVFEKSNNEANQYIQIHFSKKDQVIVFDDFKIVEGDNVDFDVKKLLKEQVDQDFISKQNGNYTAFYDIFYMNNEPKKIKLKATLNR